MLEWLWPWVFAVAPVPFVVHRLSRGESLQPSALRAPFAARWKGLSTSARQRDPVAAIGGCYGWPG